jgi:uncharacterized SAM-binding protein YcdF (DUF218 family)
MRTLDALIRPISSWYEPPASVPERADGIIGAGIALRSDGGASLMSAAVARRSAHLWHSGVAPKVLFAGGYAQNGVTEAEAMRDITLAEGVPASAIMLETASMRTHLNAQLTKPIVEHLGWRRIVLVAQHIHARRALAIFRRTYGDGYQFYLAKAHSGYELLPQRRLSSEARFLFTWELPSFALAKIKGWA